MDKALLEKFAARAEQQKKSRMEVKNFELPGIGNVPFVKLSHSDRLDFVARLAEDSANGAEGLKDIFIAHEELIYNCCPTLQDPEVLKAIGADINPYDAIPLLMDIDEASKLADQLSIWMGIKDEDDTKNA